MPGGNLIFLRHLDSNFVQKCQKCQICVIYENLECMHSSYSQLGKSGNSAISVKGKGLTNAKIYLEKKDSSKVKI